MKHIAKRSLSMLLALVMLCSLCVNALAADEVKVNSALSATELEKSASAQTVRVTVAPASAVTVSNYEVKLEVPKGWTITNIENDDPNAALTAADYNLANGQIGWTSKDAEDKSVSKFATYTVEIPANTAAGKYELKVVGVMADKNYGQDAVLTKGQHDSTLTLTVKEKTTATGYTAELSTWYTQREVGQTLTLPVYITSSEASVTTWNAATVKIKYDPRYVSFSDMQQFGLQASEVYDDKTNGVVTISRYGKDVACGNGNGTFFMAVFDCNAVGVANFQLTEARVDLQDNANVQDAPQATVKGDLFIQIGTPTYKVSGAEQELRYEPTAEAGKDFIINMQEGYVVKGLDVHYKVGGKDYTASWDADENTFIIPAQHVTGDIELYVSYHSYKITKTGSGADDVTLPQQVLDYKADYTFTLNKKDGYAYTVKVTIGGEEVTCPHAHGEQDIEEALANSCNGVFGQLAVELGGETMQKYADAAGLTKSIKVDGIQSSVGKFDFSGNDNQLAWSGVGQGQDTLCPINMLQYMGAIANSGKAAVPRLIEKSTTDYGLPTGIYYPHKSAQLIDEKTAGTIADMMHNNVIETYGQDRFPGMDICAKSGTAEVGADKSPNAWFTGFLRDEATPYAFIVLVENGGGGSSVAGTVASQVLQAAVEKGY